MAYMIDETPQNKEGIEFLQYIAFDSVNLSLKNIRKIYERLPEHELQNIEINISYNEHADATLLQKVAEKYIGKIKQQQAQYTGNNEIDIVEEHLSTTRKEILRNIAEHKNTNLETLQKIEKKEPAITRETKIINQNTTTQEIEEHLKRWPRLTTEALKHKNVPEETIKEFLKKLNPKKISADEKEKIKAVLMNKPHITDETLNEITNFINQLPKKEVTLRRILCKHTNINPNHVQHLIETTTSKQKESLYYYLVQNEKYTKQTAEHYQTGTGRLYKTGIQKMINNNPRYNEILKPLMHTARIDALDIFEMRRETLNGLTTKQVETLKHMSSSWDGTLQELKETIQNLETQKREN